MRYAIVSDLHANLQAWNAVFLDLRSQGADEIIVLGDIVGYGPNPAEVLQAVHAHAHHVVLGNHDAVVCGKLDDSLFNDAAQRLIRWTRTRLSREADRFLRTLPLTLDGGAFRCAHGDFAQPAAFNYVIEPADALACWRAVDAPLLFVGHTHQPALFVLGASGTPHLLPPQDFVLEDGKRYLVNVGAAGQPRDGDARASYCLYDAEQGTVYARRIPFDLDAYRAAVQQAGIGAETSYFLRHDPRAGVPPLRTILNFSPPKTREQEARDVVLVREIDALKRRAATWRRLFVLCACVLLGLAGLGGGAWWRHRSRGLTIRDPGLSALSATPFAADANILPELRAPAAGRGVRGWAIQLGNKRAQDFAFASDADEAVLRLISRTDRDELRLTSAPVHLARGTRLCAETYVRRGPDFKGRVELVLTVVKQTPEGETVIDRFLTKEPSEARKDGWVRAKGTPELPVNATACELSIRGRFTGTLEIKSVALRRG